MSVNRVWVGVLVRVSERAFMRVGMYIAATTDILCKYDNIHIYIFIYIHTYAYVGVFRHKVQVSAEQNVCGHSQTSRYVYYGTLVGF